MNSDDDLRKLLKNWQPDVILPQTFGSQVWQRIAVQNHGEEKLSDVLFKWIGFFPKPQYALILIVSTVLIGSRIADFQSNQEYRKLETRYIQSIDPYSQVSFTSN